MAWELTAYCRALDNEAASANLDSFLSESWYRSFQRKTISNREPRPVHKLRQAILTASTTGHDRPSSSEFLAFLSVLRLWLAGHDDSLVKRSLMACLTLIQAIQRAKFHNAASAREKNALAQGIDAAWRCYIRASIAAHGHAFIRPKHHYGGHIAEQFLRDGEIYDCFIVERLHRRSKLHARLLTSDVSFERSLVSRILTTHCHSDKLIFGWTLDAQISESHDLKCRVSSGIAGPGAYVQAGAFVRALGAVWKVMFFAEDRDDGDRVVIVAEECEPVRKTETSCSLVRPIGVAKLLQPEDVQVADAWRVFDGDCMLVLYRT